MTTPNIPGLNDADDRVTLSTGVVLRLKQPSGWAVTEVTRQMMRERPKPPVLHNPDADRDEENEADPDYQAALTDWDNRLLERKYEVVIATGTEVESVPSGMPAPNDPAWEEMLAALGIPQPAEMTPTQRYIRWVKYVAAPAWPEDWMLLVLRTAPRAGTPEVEVAAAAESFRGDAQRAGD